MSNREKTILVLGATGQQGGAVARELAARGFSVRALVRDPEKPAARALVALGIHLVKGDFSDANSLQSAMKGAEGVFSVQTPFGPGGTARETEEGIVVANAAKSAGVPHLVYTSVGGAERKSGVAHFESKFRVEEHIRGLGIRFTILRPVFFMENFGMAGPREVNGELVLRTALAPDTKLQMIAVRDIGIFAALAFEGHDSVAGRAIEIGGDAPTMAEVARAFGEATGRPVRYVRQPMAEVEAHNAELATMYRWFESSGYQADIAALRRLVPALTTLPTWLAQGNWAAPRA
jgi:uncharacterized protein YbjT (DUF2867 family)